MVQHPGSQQVKVSTTVHLPLDGFKPIDVALELTVTPGILHRVMNRFLILKDMCRGVANLQNTAGPGLLEPVGKTFGLLGFQ